LLCCVATRSRPNYTHIHFLVCLEREATFLINQRHAYRIDVFVPCFRGILLQEQSRLEEALLCYENAIRFRPRLAMAHLNMGLVLGMLGRKDEAAEVYKHCAGLDGNGLKDPKMHEATRVSALFNLGRLSADEGRYNDAIQIYQQAISKMPNHYQAQSLYNMMGEAYTKLSQHDKAEEWYKQALRAKPDHVPAHLTYAKLLAKMNRLEEAETWFLKAKSIAPNDSSIYQHYGMAIKNSFLLVLLLFSFIDLVTFMS